MLIQFLLTIVIALIVFRLIYQLKNKAVSVWFFLSWLFIWVLALVIIWYPKITTYFATLVGIGRGADLVIYISVVEIFYLMFRLFVIISKI